LLNKKIILLSFALLLLPCLLIPLVGGLLKLGIAMAKFLPSYLIFINVDQSGMVTTSTFIYYYSCFLGIEIAGCLSYALYSVSKRFQEYEFGIRLQILDEMTAISPSTSPIAFRYSAKIKNSGQKPVEIQRVIVESGSKERKECLKHNIFGRFYLSPDEAREIEFEISHNDMNNIMKKLDIAHCVFFLSIDYINFDGSSKKVSRSLGGYDRDAIAFIHQRGDALTSDINN